MRRLLPLFASVLVVLLVAQWGSGAGACLAALRFDPGAVMCHSGDAPPAPDSPHAGAGAGCPYCAPMPPGLVPSPPAPVAARVAFRLLPPATVQAAVFAPASHATPQQPRAPPAFA